MRRPGLRGLPGAYDLARLPLAVPPVAGEHGGSWLTRLAHRHALTPQGLLSAVGLATPSYNLRAMQRHLHRRAEQAARLLGAPPPLGVLTDSRCLDQALAGYQASYGRGAGRWPSGSRFCPACLAGTALDAGSSDGTGAGRDAAWVWSATWLSPLLGVCLTHQVLLLPCCPRCGQVPWSSPAWTARCGPGWTCPEHLPSPTLRPGPRATAAGQVRAGRSAGCGQDLREVPAPPAGERDVHVQQLLVQAARRAAEDPDGALVVCGVDSSHQEYLHGLLELVVESRRGTAGLWRLGSDVRRLLDSAGVAVAVLAEPDPAAAVRLAEQHGLLSVFGRCTPTGPDSVLRRRPHNDLLAALRLGVLSDTGGLSPTAQLTFRTGSDRPRYPRPGVRCAHQDAAPRPGQLPLRAVPQLLWPGLLTHHLTVHVPDDWPEQLAPDRHQDEHGDLVVGRACAAMFLARLGSTRPWRLIAIELGFPAWFAGLPPALHRRLVERGRWPVFLTELDALATALQSDLPSVDYRVRRQLCADPSRLLHAVQAGRRLVGDLPPAVPDELLARAFWQSYTGSDLRLAAPPISHADPAATAADQARIRTLHPVVAATLLAVQAVLEARGLAGSTGPLLWSPAGSDPAQAGRSLLEPWPVPPGVEPHWDGWEHQVALAAALEAAEEDLTEHAFQHWLWRWLAINYGIPDTDNTRHWPPAVWTLRRALEAGH